MTKLYLIRHGKAGQRFVDEKHDRRRELTKAGWHQAEAIAAFLARDLPRAFISSPYVRCVQTLEPAAKHAGMKVAIDARLAERTTMSALEELVAELRGARLDAAVCSHGNIIPALLELLEVWSPEANLTAKGSMHVVDLEAGTARYVPNNA